MDGEEWLDLIDIMKSEHCSAQSKHDTTQNHFQMKHGVNFRKLGRKTSHRIAMLR